MMFPRASTLSFIAILAVLLGAVPFVLPYKDDLISIITGKPSGKEVRTIVEHASSKLLTGKSEEARASIDAILAKPMSEETRVQFELLRAASYEEQDIRHASELYRAVADNPAYDAKTHGDATILLLLALTNIASPQEAKEIFAATPAWSQLWEDLSSDPHLNKEIAIAKAHELLLKTHPNFFSYLSNGEFYARKYPYVDDALKKVFEPLIFSYLRDGSFKLKEATNASSWEHSRLLLASLLRLAYSIEVYSLIKEGSLTPPDSFPPLEEVVQPPYKDSLSLIAMLPKGELAAYGAVSARLSYAEFLLREKRAPEIVSVAADLANLLENDADVRAFVETIGSSSRVREEERRKTLLALAAQSAVLRNALLSHTTSFPSTIFLAQ
jgi:hypothetical protein